MANKSKNVVEINKLHGRVVAGTKSTVLAAIKLGGLLAEEKAKAGHSNWEYWMESNLDFSPTSARRYMNLHKYKDELLKYMKTTTLAVFDLAHAYKKVAHFATKRPNQYHRDNDERRNKMRKDFADNGIKYRGDGKTKFKNPPKGTYIDKVINGDCHKVMQEMIDNGMSGKIDAVVTSIPYNNKRFYSSTFDDHKEYKVYLDGIIETFRLAYQLLKRSGRMILNFDTMLNENRNKGEYFYRLPLDLDLRIRVKELNIGFLEFDPIIWHKYNTGSVKHNKKGSATCPFLRNRKEYIYIWCKGQRELPKGSKMDITESEYNDWNYNLWDIHPNEKDFSPHPAVYPVKLTDRIIKMYVPVGGIVLDCYGGIMTSCVSAQKLGRRYIGIDLNVNYCQYGRDRIAGKNLNELYSAFYEKYPYPSQIREKFSKKAVSKPKNNITIKKLKSA